MDVVKNRTLLLTIIGLLFWNTIKAQTTKLMWVGESYQCDATSALLGLISDMSWTTNGGYFSLNGSGGYRTVTVTQYFLGTASVTCSWKYRLYSNDQWKTQSKTWYFTCQENPISITPTTMTLTVGENRHVSYAHLYDNSYVSFSNAYFESNNDAVASVSSSGVVTAVSPGTAYIVVYSKISQPTSCKVIVTDNGNSGSDDTVPPNVETDYEIVDLGLSVNWASHNLGATSPEEDGNYYAWGETTSKKIFYSSNCSTLGINAFNIYFKDKNGDWVLPSDYDAAYCSWGKQWRIPTHREFKELIEKCEWVWTAKNGRNGYEITGPNGKKIFLPASGFYDGNINSHKNALGNYLHSTIYNSHNCQGLGFRNDNIWIWDGDRHLGRSIRPVTEVKPNVLAISITLNVMNLELTQGNCASLRATVSPDDVTDRSVTWSSNNTAVAIVNENGAVTAIAPGVAIITATANDGSGVKASCEVIVKALRTSVIINDPYSEDCFIQNEDEFLSSITYIRNFRNTNWQALYVPFDIPYEVMKNDFLVAYINDVHQFDDDDNGIIDRTQVEAIRITDGVLSANYPYLIRAKEAGEKKIIVTDAKLYATEENSIDCSSVFSTYTFRGIYSRLSSDELSAKDNYYALSGGSWKSIATGTSLGAFRIYLKIDSRIQSPSHAIRMCIIGDESEDSTDIEYSELGRQNSKLVYDLQGRRVENPTKGFYIVNGKKVMIK